MYKTINDDFMNIVKSIPDNSIDLIVTDPPYKMTSRGNSGDTGGMLKKEIVRKGNVFEHNSISVNDYMPELFRILKDNSHFYIMSNHVNLYEMLTVGQNVGFKFIKCLIWDKGNKIMGRYYMSQFEYILFFRKGKDKKINNCGTSDILKVPNKKTKDENNKNLHDTEKPVELMKILIENSSNEGDIVLDPFMGIGSTVLACIESNRCGIGVEINEKYYNIAQERVSNTIQSLRALEKYKDFIIGEFNTGGLLNDKFINTSSSGCVINKSFDCFEEEVKSKIVEVIKMGIK